MLEQAYKPSNESDCGLLKWRLIFNGRTPLWLRGSDSQGFSVRILEVGEVQFKRVSKRL
jgi:hypothetical protein